MIVPVCDRPRLQERIDAANAYSDSAANTRVWNPLHNTIGQIAEYVYAKLACFAFDFDRPLKDGGQDFPLVDVKGVPSPRNWLVRDVRDHFIAPYYALVSVDVQAWSGVLVGHATSGELQDAPTRDFGYGPAHVLTSEQLRPRIAPMYYWLGA